MIGPSGPTALGRLWAVTTGRQLPENGFRMDQRTIQRGASEFILEPRGKQHQVRRWGGQAYTYTRLGRTYFDANKAKFVVSVLVWTEGRRGAGRDHWRDGEAYDRKAMMPVNHFCVGEIRMSERLSGAEKKIRIKKLVLGSVGAGAGAAEVLLHQESNERWILEPGPDWQISKLEVIEQAGGAQPRKGALMHRSPAGTPMAHSF